MTKHTQDRGGSRVTRIMAQDGFSSANLQSALLTKGLTSANLAAALAAPLVAQPAAQPAATPATAQTTTPPKD